VHRSRDASLLILEAKARSVGKVIGDSLPPGVGFALLMFDFGEGGQMTYVSNAQRDDMVRALRECADTVEDHKDSPPINPKAN